MPIKERRVRHSVEEKIWILNHRKENQHISQNNIASKFLAKFKRKTVDRTFSLFKSRFRDWKKKIKIKELQKLKSHHPYWRNGHPWICFRNWGAKFDRKASNSVLYTAVLHNLICSLTEKSQATYSSEILRVPK